MYEQVTTSISYIIAQNVKNVLVYNTNTPITLTLPDATAYKGREISIARFSDTDIADITLVATVGNVQEPPTITLPAVTGTVVTTGDSATVTNTMLAGSIANAKLSNSTISGIALGANLSTLTIGTGLTGTSYNGGTATTIAIDSTVATLTGTQTLTNKRINPRVQAVTSSATVTLNADTDDFVTITAQAAGLTVAAPSGTPVQGQAAIYRIKDNGTARSITFNAIFRAIGVTLPTTTTLSKTLYVSTMYNSTDTKWDVLGIALEA